jgi:flagellar basal-body rod protein FlgF
MDNPGYVALTRVKGLYDELRVVANNIANASTKGFRAESLVFAEVLTPADVDGEALAMAAPRAHVTSPRQGGFDGTGGEFDLAIEGDAYFQVLTPNGPRLTRAGAFTLSPEGELQNALGERVTDQGGAPIQIPPGAGAVSIAEDGTISAGGQQLGQVGLFTLPPEQLLREDGVRFRFEGQANAALDARIAQGFLEQSNVSGVEQMSRLIEVQRAYELSMRMMDNQDEIQREAVRTLGRVS